MDPNQRDTGSLTPEAPERVFEVAQSLIPAAETFARRYGLSAATAQDAIMEAAKRVVNARSSRKTKTPIKNLPAYLFRIGRNLMLEEFKQSKHEIQLDNQQLPINDAAAIERHILVSEIVRRMGPKARAIFRYRTLGYGYDEIAKEFKKMGYKATGGSLRSELSKVTKRITEELRVSREDFFSD